MSSCTSEWLETSLELYTSNSLGASFILANVLVTFKLSVMSMLAALPFCMHPWASTKHIHIHSLTLARRADEVSPPSSWLGVMLSLLTLAARPAMPAKKYVVEFC